MSNAPICHDSRNQVISQPDAKTQAPLPTTPSDLQSALNAIAMLTNALRQLQNQVDRLGGFSGFKTKKKPDNTGRWLQVTRDTEKVKVTNPNDPSQFVIVERINRLVMQDKVTGETWVWSR